MNSYIKNSLGTCKNSFKVDIEHTIEFYKKNKKKLVVGGGKVREIIKTKQNSLSESKPRSTESVTDWKLTI